MRLQIDFETRSPVDINRCGPWVYAEHPDTDVLCLAVMLPGGQRSVWANPKFFRPEEEEIDLIHNNSDFVLYFITNAREIEAHNAEFERAIWKRVMVARYGWPEIPEHKWRCSAAKAAAHALPRSLEGAAAALNLPVQKDMDGKKVMLKLCRPRKPPTEKQQEKDWKVEAERIVKETPLYAALAGGKMSAKAFLKDYDRETLKEIHDKHGPVFSPSGVRQPDEVAHDYGFESLDVFVEALKSAKPAKALIEEYVEAMRAEWHSSPEYSGRELLWHEDPADLRRLFAYCIRDVETEHALSSALDDLIPIEHEVWHLDQLMNERGFRVNPIECRAVISALATHEEKLLEELRALTFGAVRTAKQTAAMASFCGTDDMKAATVAEALNGDLDPTTRRVLEIRQSLGLSSTAKFSSMLENICSDGRIRSTLMYHGAGPGRWTGKRVQPQNFPRFTVAPGDVPFALDFFSEADLAAVSNCFGDPAEIAKGLLRPMIQAAPGYDLIAGDFAGIEMRVLFWLAGEFEALEIVRSGADIYCDMASTIYDRPITKKDKEERQVGKACLAEGTLILTPNGLVPIEEITLQDRVWDGIEFVPHDGIICQGIQEVIEYDGLIATPDHEVFTIGGRKIPIGTAASEMVWLDTTGLGPQETWSFDHPKRRNPASFGISPRFVPVRTDRNREMDESRQPPIWEVPVVREERKVADASRRGLGASVRRNHCEVQQPKTSALSPLWRAWNQVPVRIQNAIYRVCESLLAARELQRIGDRSDQQRRPLRTRQSPSCDSKTANRQSEKHLQDYMGWCQRFVERISQSVFDRTNLPYGQEGADRGTSHRTSAKEYSGEEKKLAGDRRTARVYDILNAGPRHRFTANGRLVANCILGSGYGMGAPKFRLTAKTQSGIDLDKKMARRVIRAYRKKYPGVPQYWYDTEAAAVQCVLTGEVQEFGKVTWIRDERFLFAELPSGRRIAYPFPEVTSEPAFIFPAVDEDDEPGKIMVIGDPKTARNRAQKRAEDEGLKIIGPPVAKEKNVLKFWGIVDGRWQREATYGGKLTENIDQGISRDLLAAAMLRLEAAGYRMILSVHDEAVAEVPKGFGSQEEFDLIMAELPAWAEGLPVAVEGWRGERYRK